MKIRLYNRDGAKMFLERVDNNVWKLTVDPEHDYCLKYMRCGGEFDIEEKDGKQIIHWKSRQMIDPAGGPYLEVGDVIKDDNNKEFKIIEILDDLLLKLSE